MSGRSAGPAAGAEAGRGARPASRRPAVGAGRCSQAGGSARRSPRRGQVLLPLGLWCEGGEGAVGGTGGGDGLDSLSVASEPLGCGRWRGCGTPRRRPSLSALRGGPALPAPLWPVVVGHGRCALSRADLPPSRAEFGGRPQPPSTSRAAPCPGRRPAPAPVHAASLPVLSPRCLGCGCFLVPAAAHHAFAMPVQEAAVCFGGGRGEKNQSVSMPL